MTAYRDEFPRCPRGCDCALEPAAAILARVRLVCPECSGTLVPEGPLAELMAQVKIPDYVRAEVVPLPLEPAEAGADDPPITCPSCMAVMQRYTLLGIPVDRCAAHGVWLDTDELSSLLDRAE